MTKAFILIFSLLTLLTYQATAQKMITQESTVSFYSDAVLEDITATTNKAQGIMNLENGEFYFRIPISSFAFEQELMREHFNENYMESEKYPYATFKGKLADFDKAQLSGISQTYQANGELMIHGVSMPRTIPVTIIGDINALSVQGDFQVLLEDFKIDIPRLLFQKIAERIDIKVSAQFAQLNQ